MNVSLDGFLSGPNCELDWHFNFWSIEMAEFLCDELKKADTILFGRITYNAMASYWPSKRIDLTSPLEDRAFAEMINSYTKIVFSHTITQTAWNNSFVVKENPADYITRLKQNHGRPVMVYGSGRLVGYLIAQGLVDEFHIWVHPVMLGRGKPLFKNNMIQHLQLERTKTFRNGVVSAT